MSEQEAQDAVELESRAHIERIADQLSASVNHKWSEAELWSLDRALTEAMLFGAMMALQQKRKEVSK